MESRLRKKIPATTDETTLASLPTTFVVNEKRLPANLFTLRQTLYKKAKREPTFRFYSLYGLIARLDVLAAAWDLVADNDGAPGVDGVTIQQIAAAPGGGSDAGGDAAPGVAHEAVHGASGATGIHPEA